MYGTESLIIHLKCTGFFLHVVFSPGLGTEQVLTADPQMRYAGSLCSVTKLQRGYSLMARKDGKSELQRLYGWGSPFTWIIRKVIPE